MNGKKAHTKPKNKIESDVLTTDLKQPLILRPGGKPTAVILPFEKYLHLRELETSEAERRRAAWAQLNALTQSVQRRLSAYTPAQIEAEISAARAEVKEKHHARRSRR
jgi:hypothetical protein